LEQCRDRARVSPHDGIGKIAGGERESGLEQ